MHDTHLLSVTNQCRMSNIYWAECFGPCGAAHVLQAMDRDFVARAMHSLGAAWRLVRLRLHIVFFSNSYCFQNFTFILPYFILFSFPFYLLFPFHSFYFIFAYFLFSIYMFRNVCTCIFPLAFDIFNYFLFLIFYFIWFLIISYQIYFSFIL